MTARKLKLKLSVVLADDHRLIIEGAKKALAESGEFEVVGEAIRGSQVMPLVAKTRPDVVLLDLRMPEVDGLACLQQIKRRYPETVVVVLSVSTDQKLIENVLKRGASAYIVKSVNPIDLAAAIRQAVEGTVYTAIGLGEERESHGLTERELTILTSLASGMSNAAIAREFWIAPQTVKYHLTNIYRKLGVVNRTEAARYAYQQGLVESPLSDTDTALTT